MIYLLGKRSGASFLLKNIKKTYFVIQNFKYWPRFLLVKRYYFWANINSEDNKILFFIPFPNNSLKKPLGPKSHPAVIKNTWGPICFFGNY